MAMKRRDFNRLVLAGVGISPIFARSSLVAQMSAEESQLKPRAPENRMDKQAGAFKLSVPAADIADLRERLGRTRFPDQAPGPAWEYGTDVAWMRELLEYWRDDFEWRAQEARLNAFAQYKVRLHEIDLHFPSR